MEELIKKIESLRDNFQCLEKQPIDNKDLYRIFKNQILHTFKITSSKKTFLEQNNDFDTLYAFLKNNKIIGLITKREAQALFLLAKNTNRPIVEIGTHLGLSTIFLAKHQKVYAIDFQFNKILKDIDPGFRIFFNMFYDDWADLITDIDDNSTKLQICNKGWLVSEVINDIIPICADCSDAISLVPDTELIFYDANHNYECVKDLDDYFSKVKEGGIIAVHDFNHNTPGVIGAVYNFYSRNKSILEGPYLVDSLIWFKRTKS